MDDLISRQDVLNLCDMRDKYKIPYEYDDGNKHIKGYDEGRIINVTKLKMLPSVKPQEPIGHWIIMGDRYIKCSECGHITKTESPDIYHFCMVCGANMSENPTSSKPEISSFYGLKSYVGERSKE